MPDPGFVLNLRTVEAQKEVDDAIFESEREHMEQTRIDAAAMSPRLTGKNADSIAVRLRRSVNGIVKGTIFTESGYGGLLEAGTSKMAARPYIYPAAVKNLGAIVEGIRVRLK